MPFALFALLGAKIDVNPIMVGYPRSPILEFPVRCMLLYRNQDIGIPSLYIVHMCVLGMPHEVESNQSLHNSRISQFPCDNPDMFPLNSPSG